MQSRNTPMASARHLWVIATKTDNAVEPDDAARRWYFSLMGSSGHSRTRLTTSLAAAIRWAPRQAARALVKLYRLTLSPVIGFNCRHLPSCAQYADEALERFGLWAGGWMTLARLLRCQPWGTSGLDYVPAEAPPTAHWYLPWRYGRWRGVNRNPAGPSPSA